MGPAGSAEVTTRRQHPHHLNSTLTMQAGNKSTNSEKAGQGPTQKITSLPASLQQDTLTSKVSPHEASADSGKPRSIEMCSILSESAMS